MKRDFKFSKESVETNLQFSVNKLRWNSSNLEANKDIYNTTLNGTNNIERFVNFPALVTLPYFEQGRIKF